MSDMLRSNEILLFNQVLTSLNGQFTLTLQNDGNLVVYEKLHHQDRSVNLRKIWDTETIDQDAWYAIMQEDGNFVLYDQEGDVLWQSGTREPGSVLRLTDEGTLAISEMVPRWEMEMVNRDEEEPEEEPEDEEERAADAGASAGQEAAPPAAVRHEI